MIASYNPLWIDRIELVFFYSEKSEILNGKGLIK